MSGRRVGEGEAELAVRLQGLPGMRITQGERAEEGRFLQVIEAAGDVFSALGNSFPQRRREVARVSGVNDFCRQGFLIVALVRLGARAFASKQ